MSESQFAAASQLDIHASAHTSHSPSQRRHHHIKAKVERRNFRLGVWNGILYNLGSSFISPSTVIPTFLSQLTTSSAVIGIVSQFNNIGWYLPQLFFSTFVVHKAQKMPLYKLSTALRTTMFFSMALVALVGPERNWLLALFILCAATFHLSAGMGGVVFMDLLATAIAPRKRSRFLGVRMSVGAIFSATIGASVVTALLHSDSFPRNFGWVFLVGAAIASTGLLLMAVMREPRSKGLPEARTFAEQLRVGLGILREDDLFRKYVICRLVFGIWMAGLPFLVLFARKELHFSTTDIGLFITAECIGLVIANFFSERIVHRFGTKRLISVAGAIAIAVPLSVLAFSYFPLPPLIFAGVFCLSAAFDCTLTIGGMGYLLEIAPDHERPTYIGLFNSLLALPLLLTALGGQILDWTSFRFFYFLVLIVAVAAFLLSRGLSPGREAAHAH